MSSESGRFRSPSRRTSVTIRNLRLTSMFQPDDVIHNTRAESDEAVVRQLLETLAFNYGIGNIKTASAEVMGNIEKNGIHVRDGVAVPYARLEALTEPKLAVATSKRGIDFDGAVAHLIVLILTPSDMPGAYRQILKGIEHYCEKSGSAADVAALGSAFEVWQHFDASDHRVPEYLQARHIMSEVRGFLKADDSLAAAIDLFLAKNSSELPVLNPDGELIGVVTTKMLVKVCMPDYLLWVEDMRIFLDFEPLADIVRNESYTWLRDIMVRDFAHVQQNAPVMMAMKEISRKETNNAYVLDGRKLVGVIRLREFIKALLR